MPTLIVCLVVGGLYHIKRQPNFLLYSLSHGDNIVVNVTTLRW